MSETGLSGKPAKEFKLRFTERIYRLHATGVTNHAPRGGGIFEIVLFPPGAEDGEVLYVGFEPEGGSVAAKLMQVLEGSGGLDPATLAVVQENMANAYFDAVSTSDAADDADRLDLAWAIVQAKKPRLNPLDAQTHSGRYSKVTYIEG